MKRYKLRILALIMAVMCCMAAFSVGAMAYADDPGIEPAESNYEEQSTVETEETDCYASDESDPDPEVPDAIDDINVSTEVVDIDSADPLTPDGNLTLVDDISESSDVYASDEAENKQFITVQTKNGNTFYLIIDRSSDSDNVYFLNMVDEDDLMALIESDDDVSVAACNCTEKCAIGSINTECEVCSVNMNACTGTEKVEEEPEATEEPVQATEESENTDTENSKNLLLPIILILVLAGGGVVYYLKFRKPKADTKGTTDIDDYDYGTEDEDGDTGDDLDETEYESEADDEDEENE